MKPPRIFVRVEVERKQASGVVATETRESEISINLAPREQESAFAQAVREMLRQLGR